MNRQFPSCRASALRAAVVAFAATLLALPASAATSFPDYPLQTGVTSVPPNILFILDDSYSMTYDYMPDDLASGHFSRKNSEFNLLAYDTSKNYEPWVNYLGDSVSGGQNYATSVYRNGQSLLDIGGLGTDGGQFFYVPKGSAPVGSVDRRHYYKYSIRKDDAGVVYFQQCEEDTSDSNAFDERCVSANPSARSSTEELDNYATWYSFHRTRMKAAKAGASKAFSALGRNFRVGYNTIHDDSGMTDAANEIIPVNSGSDLFEGTNKRNWFTQLQGEYVPSVDYTPLRTGLVAAGEYFKRTDRKGPWGPGEAKDQLECRQSFTILTTDGYWNKQDEDEAADLVTAELGKIGNEDDTAGPNGYVPKPPYQDAYSATLADIAMRYWKNDLRADLENDVPASGTDHANWQHMVTFGISIGLKGVLSALPTTKLGWPDPDPGDSDGVQEGIDDLWHAAVNGHGAFVAATSPSDFADAIEDALGDITNRRSSGSNVTSNGPQLNAGSRIFQATFTSGEWSGDVQGVSIAGGDIAGSASWSATAVANGAPADFLTRGVYTWDRSQADGATFPTDSQKGLLARTGGTAPVSGEDNADYLKGDRSKEGNGSDDLRKRTTPIGDIVNSSPFYSEEAAALFIGANDGMLHGINSASGKVEFSYVPAGLDFSDLASLSDPEYRHRFFVDGGIDVTTRAQGKNKNILVASLGRGGKGVFALDVTSPATFDQTSVLWDRTFSSDSSAIADDDMGYVLGAPLVRQGHNGKTLVIVGNGIESFNGEAVLFIYVLNDDGTLADDDPIKLKTGVAGGNGLAPPRAADTNLDGIADVVYAGDLKGNLWKFDITGNSNQWQNNVEKFFTAIGPGDTVQPITSAVSIAREPVTERIFVMFGTGKYISSGDLTDVSTQTLYALIDEGAAISGRSVLHKRTIPYTGVDSQGRAARAWESYSPLPETAKGWFVDLGIPTAGERVVTAPFMRSRALWFSSIIPQSGSGCDSGGTGYLNAVDAFTGTNPQFGSATGTYIDVDGDGNGDDKLKGATGDNENQFITSVDLGIGMIGQGTGVGNGVYACGSDAECGFVKTPPDGSGAKRLGWRELYNRN